MSDLTLSSFRYSLGQQPRALTVAVSCGAHLSGSSLLARALPALYALTTRLPARTPLALDCRRVGLRRVGQLSHHCIEPRRSGDRYVRAGRCVVFPSWLGSFHPRNRVLTKDSPENRSFFGEGVKVVVEVVVDLSDRSTISTTLETTFVRRRNRARKWRMLLLSCSMGTVRSLPVKSWSSGMRR